MHATAEGSAGRSATGSTVRGVLLLAAALVLGVVLLQSTDRSAVLTTTQKAPPVTTGTATTTPPSTTPPTTLPPARDPKTVKVLSANGSSVNGLAEKVKQKLLGAGYDALQPVTATVKVPTSLVYFAAGYQPEANAVAAVLGLPLTSVQALPAKAPAPGVATANVVVVSGPDLAAGLNGPASPTTTARRTTPTTHATATTAKPTSTTAAPTTSTTAAPATTTTKKP